MSLLLALLQWPVQQLGTGALITTLIHTTLTHITAQADTDMELDQTLVVSHSQLELAPPTRATHLTTNHTTNHTTHLDTTHLDQATIHTHQARPKSID